jgi:hypothetical protein
MRERLRLPRRIALRLATASPAPVAAVPPGAMR